MGHPLTEMGAPQIYGGGKCPLCPLNPSLTFSTAILMNTVLYSVLPQTNESNLPINVLIEVTPFTAHEQEYRITKKQTTVGYCYMIFA